MAIVKALDVLKTQRDATQSTANTWFKYAVDAEKDGASQPGPDNCRAVAEEWAARTAALDRIAGLVRAAQAWQQAHAALSTILLPVHTDEEADKANAALTLDAETTASLAIAVAALDAEEGKAAAPQEEGKRA